VGLGAEDWLRERGGWQGTNPFWLLLDLDDGEVVRIDLDQPGWIAEHSAAGHLRAPGYWHLVRKDWTVAGTIIVLAGEQPYYVARHVGYANVGIAGVDAEVICYGIGKKRTDGSVDRLWITEQGLVTVGEDIEKIALDLLRRGLT
jgi:hypothetical protein